ncbi:hypothetical protein BOX15_Mlig012991g1 [Macrostomum lignano]|uniref:Uncharacterized protein n=1 Tax=Macrostomum lignano TaxID=282301 RepID=A0A267GSJ5_9PLAT|nr:hypothetical protein BOX15_Mlig012991g1 [Macrostomum lignano]
MSNQPEKQSGELRRAGSQIPSQATASAAAAAVAAPTFFSRTSTFSKTLTEREKTIVTEMFDSRQRNATRTMLDNLIEKRPEDEDANEQEEEPGSEEVAGTKTEAQPQGEKATAEVDVEKRRRKKRRRLKPGEFDFSDVTDSRNLTQLTQLRLRPHELQGSWSQKLYSLVCRRLSLAPRQYIRDTLAKAKLVLANKFSQSEEILSVAVSMTDNRTLTCVEIVDNKLDTKSIAYLCHAVWECASINSFTLAGNEFTDEGLSIVIELLVATRHLHTVSLRDNRIRDVHGPKIAELLEQNRSITNLDLSYNQLGDTAAQYIGPALAENDRVRHLNLNWNCFRSLHGQEVLGADRRHQGGAAAHLLRDARHYRARHRAQNQGAHPRHHRPRQSAGDSAFLR